MRGLYISPTKNTPEIKFSPEENIFHIKGNSSPEDVRELYYPVIEWIRIFVEDIINGEGAVYSSEKPLKLEIDLEYFNSSSAKFLYDIFNDLKKLNTSKIPYSVEWLYEEQDLDMLDAGQDIALLVETEFKYIVKNK